jgi:CheY-like chemotaxis protein
MNLMIVEDNERLSEHLTSAFKQTGYETNVAPTLDRVRESLKRDWPDFVLLDAFFPTSAGELAQFNAEEALKLFADPKRQVPAVLLMSAEDKTADHFRLLSHWLSTGRIADILPKSTSGGWKFLSELLVHRTEMLRSMRTRADSDDEDRNKQNPSDCEHHV